MKKISMVALILITCATAVFSQQEIKFLDIEWGTLRPEIVGIMASKGFKQISEERTNTTFEGNIAGGNSQLCFSFYKEQYYSVAFKINSNISLEEMVSILSEKYGKANKINNDLMEEYEWGTNRATKLNIYHFKGRYNEFISLVYLNQNIYLEKIRSDLSSL